MAKRLLVTGGAGFIGSHVCEYFLEHGWSVDVMDDFSTGRRDNLPSSVGLHEVDIRASEAAALVRQGNFDAIVHLAAQMDVRRSVKEPVFDAATNILGTLNLLEAMRESSRTDCRFVFASTGGVLYGDFVTPPNREDFAKDPESPYAIAKLSAEYYLAYYARVHRLETVALRYGNVYGPRQDPHGEAGVVAIFCGRILEGQPLTIFGDGRQTRDYVYVRDVADATFRAATSALPAIGRFDSRSFNIGTGIGTPVIDIAKSLLRIAASDVAIEFAPNRRGEQQHSFVDVSKAAQLLGWRPTTDLAAGLRSSFQWFESRHHAQAVRA